jgi:FkbM family methyltransferase
MKSNMARAKEYSEVYSLIKSNLHLRKEVCEQFYSSRTARHFYNEEEIAKFKGRWSRDSHSSSSSGLSEVGSVPAEVLRLDKNISPLKTQEPQAMNPNLVYDIGMHLGQDTEFYLKKGFHVIAIEANPVLVDEQKERFKDFIARDQLRILNVGIGQERGRFTFYVNDYLSEWSSFDKEIGTRGGKFHEIEVEMVPLEDVLAICGIPYYLKIDIEGYDFIALRAIRSFSDKPKFISVENGQKPLLDFLHEEGYTQFKFINQQKVPEQKVTYPAREGVFVPHVFPFGASGLFGDETPGEWLDYHNVLKLINAYWDNPERDANIHGWFDLHAKRSLS